MGSVREDIQAAIEQLRGGEGAGGGGEGASPAMDDAGSVPGVVQSAPTEPAKPDGDSGGDGPPVEAKPGAARDAAGRFAKSAEPKAPSLAPKPDEKGASGEPQPGSGKAQPAKDTLAPTSERAGAAGPESRAPQSWKATVREKWAALPPDVQAEVVRVENEAKARIRQAAEAERVHQAFRETVAPFEGIIRAEGGDPLKVVGGLLQTAVALRTAPPAHKAQLVASLIQTYGVPIEALASALDNPQRAQAAAPPQYQDPRVDQLFAQIEQAKQARQQQLSQSAAQQLAEVQELEFFDNVRADMADLIEAKARRGVALTPRQAYDLAVQLDPELSRVMKQREDAKAAAQNQAVTQRAKAAATSVKTQPSGIAPSGDGPRSRRDDIMAAISSLQGR